MTQRPPSCNLQLNPNQQLFCKIFFLQKSSSIKNCSTKLNVQRSLPMESCEFRYHEGTASSRRHQALPRSPPGTDVSIRARQPWPALPWLSGSPADLAGRLPLASSPWGMQRLSFALWSLTTHPTPAGALMPNHRESVKGILLAEATFLQESLRL